MEIVDHDGSGENTDELISAEVDGGVDVYGLTPLVLSHDYCDRLLDVFDAQLSKSQPHSKSQMHGGNSKRYKFPFSGCLDRSLSVSKDTGLGSTVPTNDKTSSIPDWTPSEGKGDQTDVCHPEGTASLRSASRSEQCRWRLERLLGKGSEVVKMGNEEDDLTMDSICTEDFLTRFRDEMLDMPGKETQTADGPTTSRNMPDLTKPQKNHHHERVKNQLQHSSKTPLRHLTGIPIHSFDSVTIDTDLDTVRSEKVRQQLKSSLSTKTGKTFSLGREKAFHTRPVNQNNILSFSSDDEGTVEETSGESSTSKHYSRGWRSALSGRKGKRQSFHQSRKNNSYTSVGRPLDKIRMDKDQLKELRLSLAKLQQQKIAAVQSLEKLREEMYQTKKEQQSLKNIVRDSRAQVKNVRCELHRLQAQRDVCLEEIRVLQKQQTAFVQRQKMPPSCHNCVSCSVSVLERKEMDRLLNNAKSELFSEQRRFRETLDSMQEKLDEVNQEQEQKDEDFRALKQKCSNLEKQLTDDIRQREQMKETSQEDLKHQVKRFEALEQTVAQKELVLQGLEKEKKALHLELCSLKEEQNLKLTEIKNRMKTDKEQEISQLTLQLTKRHQEELQMVRQQTDEFRSAALNEQAQAHKQTLGSLYNCIQIKDEEVKKLKDEIRRQAEELRRETQEKIEMTLKREEKKWEEQKEKALKEQCGILEEQIEEVVKRERDEVEKERRNTQALQNKVTELQKVEKDAAHLKESLRRSEQELQHLRTALSERDQNHQRSEARHEWQISNWAQDIHTECVGLKELLKHNGLTVDSKQMSDSPTVHEALQTLQSLTKAIQQLINDLKNEINSQRHTALQLSLDKDQELRLQQEQLTEEKEQALASLKEKLLQEHIEKMSSLSRTRLHINDDTDGLFARLRRQLKAKDDELRLVQKNMTEWKDKTTARLTHKIQLELTAELDSRVPKSRAEQQKRLERLENEMRHLTGQCRDYRESHLSSTAFQSGPDFQHSSTTKDLTSYKLLQHLQSRIRQLRKESQTHPVKRDRDARNLGGSYLDTIAAAPESYKKEDCSSARTISS